MSLQARRTCSYVLCYGACARNAVRVEQMRERWARAMWAQLLGNSQVCSRAAREQEPVSSQTLFGAGPHCAWTTLLLLRAERVS